MVSLPPETAKKAKEMDNFSMYIRDCLRGTQHLKLQALQRRVKHLEKVILIGLKMGSAHPDFIEEAGMIAVKEESE